ncbi:MAG TPA: hypothetical protein VM784_01595 [Actinomycetota bacterium]|nr:hypothetical protein [Actinomycetota bacterium]
MALYQTENLLYGEDIDAGYASRIDGLGPEIENQYQRLVFVYARILIKRMRDAH